MESSSSIAGSRSTLGVGNLRSTGALYYLYLATSRPKVTEDSYVATRLILESLYWITKIGPFALKSKIILLKKFGVLSIAVAYRIQEKIPEVIRIWFLTKFLTNYNESFLYLCLNFAITFWIQCVRYYFRKNFNEILTDASQICFAIVRDFLQVWAWSHFNADAMWQAFIQAKKWTMIV